MLTTLQSGINSLFDELNTDFTFRPLTTMSGGTGVTGGTNWFSPKMDVKETEDMMMICCELPGMDKNEVRIEMDEMGNMTISGEKKMENEDKSCGYRCMERR